MKLPIVSACVLISSVSLANASTLVIDDFSYDLAFDAVVTNWNSFGAAATAGAGVFHPGEGVDGSNAMRFALDWRGPSNTNANARRINLNNLDLSAFNSVTVEARITTRDTFSDPLAPTLFKVAFQGTNNSIWQTPTLLAPTIVSDTYQSYVFFFDDLELADGTGSVADVMGDLNNIRLRFENAGGQQSRQDVFISSVTASVTPIPEPATWSALMGVGCLGVALLRRRKRE